ncbi:Polyketide synthase [Halomicronema hongdechloris C2206]|uniref:Phenolphthiocerol/phthiocerol polyketide synthase subunit E n=1 Tax=Halomicronema hongdechloris C2206 TaxID=1641165 RepID=A0A1Z3HL67_9CYAN|nr:type I polyketide synthase [Halomicronema hongdechloris]ASC71043.1 Polyketide synthase [Halomicronema hongdechloris C2206]
MGNIETYESVEGIAVIGMAGRFPGAKSIEEFWQNLCDGVESISFFTDEELIASGIGASVLNDPHYVKAGAVLDDIEFFDASFFDINPREAEVTDPQHRIFLECAWEALENAGYDTTRCRNRIGVYAGTGINNYLPFDISRDPMGSAQCYQTLIGNDKDFLTTRISYKLNLKGPSVTVQTACSTSLVSTTLACQSLLNYQCDVALVGGISIRVPQKIGHLYQEEGVLSADGHCRAFDAKAQGTVLGNGVGTVVLKRLEDAIADGDCIHAVIKGSAINNDGSGKVGYTAPSVEGQTEVIAEALALAEIESETVSYIETHGTGTSLGDPIEIAALTKVFRGSTDKKGFCAIGSVKTNVGHLDTAAGVTSLIKTVLALKHKQIPPSLNFKEPNPEIDFANSPFYVNTQLSEWKVNETPRRAGVSSFGIGGTNAHLILEEAPSVETSSSFRPWQLLLLSAKTSSALETATTNLGDHLQQHSELNLADVAYTLQVGRRQFDHRRAVVCQDLQDAIAALQNPKRVLTSSIQDTGTRSVAFMFTGLGPQYVNMGRELYQCQPTFREHVEHCCKILRPLLGLDLITVLYPDQDESSDDTGADLAQSGIDLRQMLGRSEEPVNAASQQLNQTWLTQPALFVIEYALAQLWQAWGVRPRAMIGYSIGEYVAACLAGVLSLEDALMLVARRAQLIQSLPSGAMLAIPLSEQEVQPLLGENLSLSAINGSSLCVVAGATDAIDELENQLTQQGLACRRLATSHAFHSHMMASMVDSFSRLVKTIRFKPPQIPYISNVTGTWITAAEATNPDYWTQHLCQPVRFADGVSQLWQKYTPALLEVGPGQTLSSLALQCLENQQVTDKVVLPSLRYTYDRQSDVAFLLNTLGQLWLAGILIDWSGFYINERRHRLPLPTYPFERQRYWIEPQKPGNPVNSGASNSQQKLDITEWFHIPSWKRAAPPVPFESGKWGNRKQPWLVLVDRCGVGSQLVKQLEKECQDIIIVGIGEEFRKLNQQEYTINPGKRDDYDTLLCELHFSNKIPKSIVHLWTITANEQAEPGLESWEQIQSLSFYSLLFLAQALGEQGIDDPLHIDIISNNLQELTDTDDICPEKATLLGPCRVIPQEYSNITCRSIDITLPQSGTRQWQQLIDQLFSELAAPTADKVIAYRGNRRWVQCFEPLPVAGKTLRTAKLRQGGVYLITGGLGGLGLAIAQHLAKTVQAKLVIIERSGLPPKTEWEQWLSNHEEDNPVSIKIKKVQAMEEFGAEVLVIKADVTHLEQMQGMVDRVRDRFGEIHGIIQTTPPIGASIIQLKTTESAASILNFKVKGAMVLDAVLKDTQLDFLVLFSSINAITGGLGQVDYSAGNAFLDAFAHYNFYRRNIHTVSINWDPGPGHNLQAAVSPEIQAGLRQMRERYGIEFKKGIAALWHILSSQQPQVVVSTRNLQTLFEENEVLAAASLLENLEKRHPQSTQLRPNLKTAYVAPRNETECKIAELYQELLGVDRIGIHDNFFDVGGNSLIGIQLLSRLRQEFQVELSLRFIFEAPSVAELALIIEEILIREIEELTENEAEELVSVLPQSSEQTPRVVSQRRYKLPNHLEIAYQTKTEADYFYQDIFENKVYLKHGIALNEGDCIFDVGANIGLFTLFAYQHCKNPIIYAFEPAPPLFEILSFNTALHEVNVKLFNVGLSNETKTATFTFYPQSSGMSSFYGDRGEEQEVLKAIMLNQLQTGMAGMEQVMQYSDELLEERFKSQSFTCQLKTLSDVISENNIENIDLLKIDVQKSELDVLQGIKDKDWKKIKQIVLEIHDTEGRLVQITNLLKTQKYNVVAEQEDLYENSNIYNVYAAR